MQAVGEQVHYAVSDAQGVWIAVLIFAAAALHLRPREQWIGWSDEQRRRRLALVANNVRFLLLPGRTVPNLGSVVLSRVLARLSKDWQERYAHPVLVVETFVDREHFQGTVYLASGWSEVGRTKGHGRQSSDYYENHDRTKRLFVRELVRHARRSLQAEHLKPALAAVEAKVPVRSPLQAAALQSLADHFRAVPDYRGRMGPVSALRAAGDRRLRLSRRRAARPKGLGRLRPSALRAPTRRSGRAPHRCRVVSRAQPADLLPPVRVF